MQYLPHLLLSVPLLAIPAYAADTPPAIPAAKPQVPPHTPTNTRAAPRKVTAVTTVAPGQAGYVHYFLLTHANGELEYQVAIEMDNQRVAWSFPGLGVTTSHFIKQGTIEAAGQKYAIEHLYGVRPFAEDAAMRALQNDLQRRVAYWVDNETPYCFLRQPGERFCLSCGDFVVRILYPGLHPLIPSLPADFLRATGTAYTTDDLLIYLVGLHDMPDRRAKRAMLAKLDIPSVMREDLIAMIGTSEAETAPSNVANAPPPAPTTAATTNPSTLPSPAARAATAKPAPSGRVATRRTQGKRI